MKGVEKMETTFSEPKFTDGKVIALIDVELVEGIVVRGFRIVDAGNGPFASVPSRPYETDGQTKYYPMVTFSNQDLKERFKAELLERYQQWNKTREPGNGRDDGSSGEYR
jgi:DNA-binding cell septation regulator SpoVG